MNRDSIQRGRASTKWARLCATLGILCAGACKTEVSKPAPATAGSASGSAGAPSAAAAPATPPAPPKPAAPAPKALEWDDPAEWKRVPPSSAMRRASYEIPPARGDSKAGELNVFVLGGDVDANIQRWIDEFSGFDPKHLVRQDRSVNELRQAVVEIPKGKFSGGMSEIQASDNYGLLGAIVVAPSGGEYFFKLTGPSATVKAAKAPFYRMLDSVRLQGASVGVKPETAPPTTSKSTGPSTPAKK